MLRNASPLLFGQGRPALPRRRVRSTPLLLLALCAVGLAPSAASAAGPGLWSPVGALNAPRGDAAAASLPGGAVLVAGGADDSNTAQATAERFDPTTDLWTSVAPMHVARTAAVAVTLHDGRVLVAGGRQAGSVYDASAELYDAAAGTWTSTGPMAAGRALAGAVVLADGRVLVVGGDGPADAAVGAELYDPATNAWTPTGPVAHVRESPGVVALHDGRVLAAGGWDGGDQASAELFDPTTSTWTAAAPMTEPRTEPGAAVLPDGRVLVAGGNGWADGHPTASRTAELYDPQTNAWARTGDLAVPRGEGNTMETLADGRPMIIGGFWWTVVNAGPPPTWSASRDEATAETYDAASGTWTPTAPMAYGSAGHVSAVLPNGDVLVAGGYGALTGAERLSSGDPTAGLPAADPPQAPAPIAAVTTPTTPKPSAHAARVPARHATAAFARPTPKRLTLSRAGAVDVKVRCSGGATCRGQVVLKTRYGKPLRTLGRARFTVRSGRAATVRITLSKATRHRLAGHATAVTIALVGQKRTFTATLRG
jgi:hypothetical protein